MRSHRSRLAVAAVVATVALVLAGCTTSSSNDSSSTGPLPKLEPGLYKGVNLTLWSAQTSGNKALSTVYKDFEAASGAKINPEIIPGTYESTLQTQWASGERPDLMFWNPIASQAAALNAGETMQRFDKETWWKKVPDAVKGVSGVVKGIPHAAVFEFPVSYGVFYNKKVFEKNNISIPTGGWNDYLKVAEQLKADGVTPTYEVGLDMWPLQWAPNMLLAEDVKNGWASGLNTHKTDFSDSQFTGAVTKYDELFQRGLVNSDVKAGTYQAQLDQLWKGDVGMVTQGSFIVPTLIQSYGVDAVNSTIGFFPLSSKGTTLTWSPDQSTTFYAPKTGDAKKEQAARSFINFLFSSAEYSKFLKLAGTAPALNGVPTPNNLPDVMKSVSKAFFADSQCQWDCYALAKPDIQIYLGDLINGRTDVKGVGASMDAQFAKTLHAQGVKGF